jgi:ABC-2 type transport system permease protein
MNKIRLIIWREFITRVRKPSFLIMTILGPLLLIGGVVLAGFIALQESGKHKVLVIDEAGLVTGKLKDTDAIAFDYSPIALDDSLFVKGDYTLMVLVASNITYVPKLKITYRTSPSQFVQEYIVRGIEREVEGAKLKLNNIDPGTYANIKTRLEVGLFDVKDSGKESHDQQKALIGFACGYLIFFFVLLYGLQVMRGVMEEKQSRIVEVLISSVKPFQLMMGKIVGIAMVGLAQFLLWVLLSGLLGSVGYALAQDKLTAFAEQQQHGMLTEQLKDQLGENAGMDGNAKEEQAKFIETFNTGKAIWDELPVAWILVLFVFYFLGGYLLYASLYAAVGSAVDSEADSQQFMMPVMIPMFLGIFVAQMAVINPDGPAVFWCSIIPLTSPVVMMIRVAMGNAFEHPWHLVLSMALLVGTFIFTTWLAGRIYRTGILMYGKKVTWKELGKWLFYRG